MTFRSLLLLLLLPCVAFGGNWEVELILDTMATGTTGAQTINVSGAATPSGVYTAYVGHTVGGTDSLGKWVTQPTTNTAGTGVWSWGLMTSTNYQDHTQYTNNNMYNNNYGPNLYGSTDDDYYLWTYDNLSPYYTPSAQRGSSAWGSGSYVYTIGASQTYASVLGSLVFGGDSVEVGYIENFYMASTGQYTTTAVGFESDLIIFMPSQVYCATCDNDDMNGASNGNVIWQMGVATDSLNQYSILTYIVDSASANNSMNGAIILSDKHVGFPQTRFGTTIDTACNFTLGSITSNGFTIHYDEGGSTDNDAFMVALCIRFGGSAGVEVGVDTYPTSTGVTAHTTTIQPDLVWTVSNGAAALNTIEYNSGGHQGVSMWDDTKMWSGYIATDEVNNDANGYVRTYKAIDAINMASQSDSGWSGGTPSSDFDWYGDYDSFNATDFSIDYTTATNATGYFLWVAFSDGVGGGDVGGDTRRLHYLKRWGL